LDTSILFEHPPIALNQRLNGSNFVPSGSQNKAKTKSEQFEIVRFFLFETTALSTKNRAAHKPKIPET